jgi:hypothetical protein
VIVPVRPMFKLVLRRLFLLLACVRYWALPVLLSWFRLLRWLAGSPWIWISSEAVDGVTRLFTLGLAIPLVTRGYLGEKAGDVLAVMLLWPDLLCSSCSMILEHIAIDFSFM